MMPSDPPAHLVMIEARLTIPRLEQLLDPMTLPLGADHSRQRVLGTRVGQRVVRPRLTDRSDHHQPLLRPDPTLLPGTDPNCHGIDDERPLLAVADRDPLPTRPRLARRPEVGPHEGDLPLAATPRVTTP